MAALTMPALVANYQKKVLSTRIQKFYSVINQAVNTKIAETGSFDGDMGMGADAALDWFNENYAPYIKYTEVVKRTRGVAVGLPDGSGMYIKKNWSSLSHGMIYFCVDYKICKTSDKIETMSDPPYTDGKTVFAFFPDGSVPSDSVRGSDRAALLAACSSTGGYATYFCAKLIQVDGWEIKDDYPWL